MEGNLLKEINYLTQLIEQHKKHSEALRNNAQLLQFSKDISLQKPKHIATLSHKSQINLVASSDKMDKDLYAKSKPTTINVHVNPNFKPITPAIHINPKIQLKPLIHVNPKMMKDVASSNKNLNNNRVMPTMVPTTVQVDIKRSVYVNPKLMTKLSSAAESKTLGKNEVTPTSNHINSRLKQVKSTSNLNTTQKTSSNVVVLSRRKLIRMRRASKGSFTSPSINMPKIKRFSISPFKKLKTVLPKTTKCDVKIGPNLELIRKNCLTTKMHTVKNKLNRYKIDRTVPQTSKTSEISEMKKSKRKTMEFITIGGIVYKSSRNQLVRRSYSLKKKCTTNIKRDNFIIATNGKKLQRLKEIKDTSNSASLLTTSVNQEQKIGLGLLQKLNYKTNISHKVKQRSIQILRNKMRKNNQPCLLFQKFGFCANQKNGTCPRLHDKKQVSVCKMFLQGRCLLEDCPLSHDVGPEKMPTCKYFLEGCCIRDSCPYLHVKVSSKTPICIEFLKGYCAKGNECKRRHQCMCPEFDKNGKCSKGKYCPYPHKSNLFSTKHADKHFQRKREVTKSEKVSLVNEDRMMINNENRFRYYERSSDETIDKKRENIMKKINIMKNVEIANQAAQLTSDMLVKAQKEEITNVKELDKELDSESENKRPQRLPIGFLPAYIPIN